MYSILYSIVNSILYSIGYIIVYSIVYRIVCSIVCSIVYSIMYSIVHSIVYSIVYSILYSIVYSQVFLQPIALVWLVARTVFRFSNLAPVMAATLVTFGGATSRDDHFEKPRAWFARLGLEVIVKTPGRAIAHSTGASRAPHACCIAQVTPSATSPGRTTHRCRRRFVRILSTACAPRGRRVLFFCITYFAFPVSVGRAWRVQGGGEVACRKLDGQRRGPRAVRRRGRRAHPAARRQARCGLWCAFIHAQRSALRSALRSAPCRLQQRRHTGIRPGRPVARAGPGVLQWCALPSFVCVPCARGPSCARARVIIPYVCRRTVVRPSGSRHRAGCAPARPVHFAGEVLGGRLRRARHVCTSAAPSEHVVLLVAIECRGLLPAGTPVWQHGGRHAYEVCRIVARAARLSCSSRCVRRARMRS